MLEVKTKVLISGGGPVGLTLALELSRQGVECLIVNEQETTSTHPKANAINARSMEHFRRLGVSSEIREAGLPENYPTDVTYVTRLTGYEIARLSMPSRARALEEAKAGTSPYDCAEPPHRCSQIYLESILYKSALQNPLINVLFGYRLESFIESESEIIANVENISNGECIIIKADYLVGADGGRSMVRRELGIRYEGEAGIERRMMGGSMMATYFRLSRDLSWLKISPSWQYWIVSSDFRALLMTVNGKDEFVLLSRVQENTNNDRIDDLELISLAAGCSVDAEIILSQSWTAGHALIAESYGRRRVWLVGDSTHLFTPTGGLGMNTGVDDAINLAWKLSALVNGWGGPNLLSSYEEDRRPIGLRNLAFAKSFAESIGSFEVSSNIESEKFQGQEERRVLGSFLADHGKREFIIPGIVLGVRYENSSIIWPDGTLPVRDDPYDYVPTSRPGSRAPHVWLAGGLALCDFFSPGFTLIRQNQENDINDLLSAANDIGVPISLLDLEHDEICEFYERELTLVGPDGHVTWRGDALPQNTINFLDRIRGM